MSTPQNQNNNLSWKADDFYYHPKDFSWYLLALLISFVLALVPWLISGGEDLISPAVIFIALLGLIIYANRKPQKKNYQLTNTELKINSQKFDLFIFSSYWVEVFETHTEITLIGLKRTTLPVSLSLTDKELTKKIINILQTSLPQTNPSNNPVDWLMRKIKF